jgi:hypothetical protein
MTGAGLGIGDASGEAIVESGRDRADTVRLAAIRCARAAASVSSAAAFCGKGGGGVEEGDEAKVGGFSRRACSKPGRHAIKPGIGATAQ